MADATLPLNPVTPLYQGAAVASTNPLAVTTIAASGAGWSYFHTATAGTSIIKASAGTLHTATVNNFATGASMSIVDAAATAGTPLIAVVICSTPVTVTFDAAFSTGLLITTATATSNIPDVTLTYK